MQIAQQLRQDEYVCQMSWMTEVEDAASAASGRQALSYVVRCCWQGAIRAQAATQLKYEYTQYPASRRITQIVPLVRPASARPRRAGVL